MEKVRNYVEKERGKIRIVYLKAVNTAKRKGVHHLEDDPEVQYWLGRLNSLDNIYYDVKNKRLAYA